MPSLQSSPESQWIPVSDTGGLLESRTATDGVIVVRLVGTENAGNEPSMRPVLEAFSAVLLDQSRKTVILGEVIGLIDSDYLQLGRTTADFEITELVAVGSRASRLMREGAASGRIPIVVTPGGTDDVEAFVRMLNRPWSGQHAILCGVGLRGLADRLVDERPTRIRGSLA